MKAYLYTDGASRGNPGVSGSGFSILDEAHRQVASEVFYNGTCTNNVAEYKGVIAALKKALAMFGPDAEVVLSSDSSVVINQLSGNFKTRSGNLKALNREAKALLGKFAKTQLLNVPRENAHIAAVDLEINNYLDSLGAREEGGAREQRLLRQPANKSTDK